jgi:hypothetical protein
VDFTHGGLKLGQLLGNIRTKKTSISPHALLELNEMGYNGGQSYLESKWKFVYLPAFRACKHGKNGRLWEMTARFEHGQLKLGVLLQSRNRSSIPPHYLMELNEMGLQRGSEQS